MNHLSEVYGQHMQSVRACFAHILNQNLVATTQRVVRFRDALRQLPNYTRMYLVESQFSHTIANLLQVLEEDSDALAIGMGMEDNNGGGNNFINGNNQGPPNGGNNQGPPNGGNNLLPEFPQGVPAA